MLRDVSWLALRKCTSEKLGLVFLYQSYIKRKIMHANDLNILVILVGKNWFFYISLTSKEKSCTLTTWTSL